MGNLAALDRRLAPARRKACRRLACLVALAWAGLASGLRAEVIEIHDLHPWSDFENRPVVVGGRFQSAAQGRLRLVDSQLDFRLAPGVRIPRPAPRHLELRGRLRRQGEQWVFLVEFVGSGPSEAEQFARQQAHLADSDWSRQVALGNWARERGAWYHDPELTTLAVGAYRRALALRRAVADEHPQTGEAWMLALLAEWLGWPPEEVQAWQHHWLVQASRQTRPGDAAGWRPLAAMVARWLPGARLPATVPSEFDAAAYLAAPDEVYPRLSPAMRRQAHRALWVEFTTRWLRARAALPAADLEQLALEAQRLVPERDELAGEFRLASARRGADNPTELSRRDLGQARAALLALGRHDEAAQLTEAWVGAERLRLGRRDSRGRIRLAEDVRQWGVGDQLVAELAQEALAIEPELARAGELLHELGYEKFGGQWRRRDELKPSQLASERAGSGDGIGPGTTEQEVVRQLRKPDRVTRVVTGRQVTEQWIYDGPPRLELYLRRPSDGRPARVLGSVSP